LKEPKHLEIPGEDAKITLKWTLKEERMGGRGLCLRIWGKLFNKIMHFNKADLQLNKVDADSALLGYKAASLCNEFPVYRRIIVPSSSTSLKR
jgi:hypothetical protein